MLLFYATNVCNWRWYVTVGMSRKIHCINVSTLMKLTVLFIAIFIIYRQVFLQFSTDNKLLWLIEFGLNRIPQLAVLPHASHTPVDTGSQLLPPHRGGLRHLCFEAVCPKHRISWHGSIPLMFLLSSTCHPIFFSLHILKFPKFDKKMLKRRTETDTPLSTEPDCFGPFTLWRYCALGHQHDHPFLSICHSLGKTGWELLYLNRFLCNEKQDK